MEDTGKIAENNNLLIPSSGPHKEPDWCFSLAKQTYRHTKVDTLDDIANSVSRSSFINVPQLVDTVDGTCKVSIYDWVGFFDKHSHKKH